MAGSFLTDVKGFTPVIDALAEELGLIPAVVYGVAWRFCQMKDGICHASLETIAKRVGISRATARRHIKDLCATGYLEDLTPELRHRPHRYRDTGKAQIIGLVTARVGESESTTPEPTGGSERPAKVGHSDPPGGSERPTSRVSEERTQESSTIPDRAKLFRMIAKAGIVVSSFQSPHYVALLEDSTIERVGLAFADAKKRGKQPRWQYLKSILDRCNEYNCDPGEWPDKPNKPETPGKPFARDGEPDIVRYIAIDGSTKEMTRG